MKKVDILLVMGYFRSATAFLSVVRYLTPTLRIGVLNAGSDPLLKRKTGNAEALFMRLCEQFGADIIGLDQPVETQLMVVQQFVYPDEVTSRLMSSVKAVRVIGMLTLAMAGLDKHDRFLTQFSIDTVLAPSRRLTDFLLRRRGALDRYRDVTVENVGLPFRQYPVFPEFSVDWLIAAPTLFSFHSEVAKHSFLKNVLALLEQMPDSDVVVYKPHNGNVLDYFAPRYHYALARLTARFPPLVRIAECLAQRATGPLKRHAQAVVTGLLHLRVLKRAKPMSDVTPYADISLEAFLPGVKKGVIGGLSNTIWGAMYFDLPFFNCIDPSLRAKSSELLDKSSASLLDLNLEFFGVPYCRGQLVAGAEGSAAVTKSDRQGDLLAAITSAYERVAA